MITVIGGGPAGRIAAMRIASAGREVRLIDRGPLGGQCLHHGCMVVCALSDVASLVQQTRSLAKLGVLDDAPSVVFPELLKEMARIQGTITRVLDTETEEAGVTLTRGDAQIDGTTVRVDGKEIESEAILIATGSRPLVPEIEGIDLKGVVTPHTLQLLEELPARLAIIGGGVVAAEFAYIFQAFGSEVDLICRSGFLRGTEKRLRENARRELGAVNIREHSTVSRIAGKGKVETIELQGEGEPEEKPVDAVMVAAGLVPRTEQITGVNKGTRGEIIVDRQMRTNVESIFAAGDVTGPPYLTPVARREGTVAADVILGRDARMDYEGVPQSIKLQFEHAFSAVDTESAVSVTFPSPAGPGSFWAVADRYTGTSTIDFEPESGRITGFYAAAPATSMMGSYLAYLMRAGVTLDELAGLLEIHPSTDGIYSIVRYASEWRRKKGF